MRSRSVILFLAAGLCSMKASGSSIWQQTTADSAFAYRREIESVAAQTRRKNSANALLDLLQRLDMSSIAILLVVVFLVVMGWLIFRRMNFERVLPRRSESLTDAEALQQESPDLERRLEEEIRAGNWAQAVRYRYLLLLSALIRRELLTFGAYKTNHEYLRELGSHPLAAALKRLTRSYEYAVYGGYPITEARFRELEQEFRQADQTLPAR